MATIFPREEKTDLLFHKILANPEACRLLTRTVYDQMDQYGDEPVMITLQKELPGAAVFYGQDSITDHGNQFDGLGIFLSKHHLKPSFEKKLDVVTRIVRSIA